MIMDNTLFKSNLNINVLIVLLDVKLVLLKILITPEPSHVILVVKDISNPQTKEDVFLIVKKINSKDLMVVSPAIQLVLLVKKEEVRIVLLVLKVMKRMITISV